MPDAWCLLMVPPPRLSDLRPERRRPRESAHELLQRRLASGDITAEEYEKRKALLERDAPSKT